RRHAAGRERPAGRVDDELPPLVGVLDRAAAGQPAGLDRAMVPPRGPAGQRDEPDLRSARSEVDRQDEALVAPRRRVCGGQGDGRTVSWLSIMSAMTVRMNSSASSVSPPATPP